MKQRDDIDALQGQWRQIAFEADGVANAYDDVEGTDGITTITGNDFAVHDPHGRLLLRGQFVLDASTQPKCINWIDAIGPDEGKSLPAIYRLEGDDFVFVATSEGKPRPREFRTIAGQVMRTFKRHV